MLFPKIYLQDPEIFSLVLFISGLKPKIPGLQVDDLHAGQINNPSFVCQACMLQVMIKLDSWLQT